MRYLCLGIIFSILTLGIASESKSAFYSAAESLRPDCFNPSLVRKVKSAVHAYQESNRAESLLEQRRQKLLLKNIGNFVPVNSDNFTSQDDLRTANKLIMLKINEGIESSAITLCKNSGSGANYNLYLLIYPQSTDSYKVEIINFLPLSPEGTDLSFIY